MPDTPRAGRAGSDAHQQEVDRNYQAFQKLVPDLVKSHPGKYALMRNGEVVEFFDTARDAHAAGSKLYADGLFSVQQVTHEPVDLGFFSRALP